MGIGSILFGYFGAFVRWMFKGFKGTYKKTLDGPENYELPDRAAYEMTNIFIGAFSLLFIWGILVLIKCEQSKGEITPAPNVFMNLNDHSIFVADSFYNNYVISELHISAQSLESQAKYFYYYRKEGKGQKEFENVYDTIMPDNFLKFDGWSMDSLEKCFSTIVVFVRVGSHKGYLGTYKTDTKHDSMITLKFVPERKE